MSLTQDGQWIKPHILPAEIPLAATSNSCGFFRPLIWASPGQAELVITSSVLAILTDFHSDNLSSKGYLLSFRLSGVATALSAPFELSVASTGQHNENERWVAHALLVATGYFKSHAPVQCQPASARRMDASIIPFRQCRPQGGLSANRRQSVGAKHTPHWKPKLTTNLLS